MASLRPQLINRLAHSGAPLNRIRARGWRPLKPSAVEFYYEPGDPHSHLAAQLLPLLVDGLKIPLHIFVISQTESAIYPEMERQRRYNYLDCARIAGAYGLSFPNSASVVSDSARLKASRYLLAASEDVHTFITREPSIANELFQGGQNFTGSALNDVDTQARLQTNNSRRDKLGHYLPAMWQFDGEWFWGVDRFQRLLRKVKLAGLWSGDPESFHCDARGATLPEISDDPPLECFLSFRSPYSYLAAAQLQRCLPQLQRPLVIRPVLPMAMRGYKVPLAKQLYILRDAAREAKSAGIPFGLASDPIGEGALRCLQVFPQNGTPEEQLDFVVSACRGAWSEAIDLATDAGLQQVCERVGIDPSTAQSRIKNGDIGYAERNREALFEAGLWGVPGFRVGEFSTWGRDRLWLVEELLRRSA